MADYLPELAELDRSVFFGQASDSPIWLGGSVDVQPLAIPRDTPDWMLDSFWAHPERVLDPDARAAPSGFARMSEDVVERVVASVRADLEDGSWNRRHGELRTLDALVVGLRLVIAKP